MVTTEKQIIKTVNIHCCDFCDRTSETNGIYTVKCFGCKKDICNRCYHIVEDLHEGRHGDCDNKICQQCANKIQPYIHLCELIRDKTYNNIEKLIEKWKEECLNQNITD